MSEPTPLRRRSALGVIVMSAVLCAGGVVAAPPLSASALGCTIAPSLQAAAAREGISCGAGVDTGGGGPSPSSPVTTPCRFGVNMGELTDTFLSFLNDPFVEYSHLYGTMMDPTPRPYTEREYSKNGKKTGYVAITPGDGGTGYRFTLDKVDGLNLHKVATFDCKNSQDGFTFVSYTDQPAMTPHVTPVPGPASDLDTQLTVSDAITALPGKPNEYLLRLDLTKTGTSSSPTVSVALPAPWQSAELISGPRDTETASVEGVVNFFIPGLEAGDTATLVLHVTAASSASGPMPVSVFSIARWKLRFSIARAATWTDMPVASALAVDLP